MGRPVTDATDSAAPPRASPSSFDSTTPVKSTPSWKALAVFTASWPIIASMTKSTSSGLVALRMSEACFISSASTPRRPAVSMMTTSCWCRRAYSTPSFETRIGSPTPLPGSGAKIVAPARSATTCSWFTAFGRCRSAATSSGVCPSASSCLASFPANVVFPDPWSPASMMTVGGFLANWSRRCSPPRIATSSSFTICTTCCAGFSALFTSSPSARSRTFAVKSLTTCRATSASRRARRISRTVPSTSAGVSFPFVRRLRKVSVSRSESVPNVAMVPLILRERRASSGQPQGRSWTPRRASSNFSSRVA